MISIQWDWQELGLKTYVGDLVRACELRGNDSEGRLIACSSMAAGPTPWDHAE